MMTLHETEYNYLYLLLINREMESCSMHCFFLKYHTTLQFDTKTTKNPKEFRKIIS